MLQIDISDKLVWDDYFPHPDWETLRPALESQDPADRVQAQDDIVRQWLDKLADIFPGHYRVAESDHHFLLCLNDFQHRAALGLARECRGFLLRELPGISPLATKVPILIWHDRKTYYDYLARFYPEGHHGASSGVHIRHDCQHIVLWGKDLTSVDSTIAHELTHEGLCIADLPLWIEEGLAQIVEHDLTGRQLAPLTTKMAAIQKRYWRRFGLQAFWDGTAFGQASRVSELAYQLAEVLLRLLLDDSRPRWFGLVRSHRPKLVGFLSTASIADAGEAAAQKHLSMTLTELVARFLGPGDWAPRPIDRGEIPPPALSNVG